MKFFIEILNNDASVQSRQQICTPSTEEMFELLATVTCMVFEGRFKLPGDTELITETLKRPDELTPLEFHFFFTGAHSVIFCAEPTNIVCLKLTTYPYSASPNLNYWEVEALKTLIDYGEFSVRTKNFLLCPDGKPAMKYFWQLSMLTDQEILNHLNIGKKSVREVHEILRDMRLRTGMKRGIELILHLLPQPEEEDNIV